MGRFEDERGTIEDLFDGEPVYVTRIITHDGAVRGNHFHRHTEQWTLLCSGRLLVASGSERDLLNPGDMVQHPPGQPHAWQSWADGTECLVFTKGPRGEDYESDTIRLDDPLL
jgi:quercetin dioxygenase-like cupin family protein